MKRCNIHLSGHGSWYRRMLNPGCLLACVMMALAACEQPPDTLTVIVPEVPRPFNPLKQANQPGKIAQELLFDGLYNRSGMDDIGKPLFKFGLAEVVEEVDPQRLFKITLRDSIYWHGDMNASLTPFSRDDVIWTFTQMKHYFNQLRQQGGAQLAAHEFLGKTLRVIESIEPEPSDDRALLIRTRAKTSTERLQIALAFKVLPRRYQGFEWDPVKESLGFESGPVGTGPYKWSSSPNNTMHFPMNASYFAFDAPSNGVYVPAIELKYIPDRSLYERTLVNRDANFSYNVIPSDRSELGEYYRSPYTYSSLGFWTLVFNTRDETLQDLEVRQALYAIFGEREKVRLLDAYMHGADIPGIHDYRKMLNSGIFPHNSWLMRLNAGKESRPFSQVVSESDQAFRDKYRKNIRNILRARGITSLTLTTSVRALGEDGMRMAQECVEVLKEYGIETEIVRTEKNLGSAVLSPGEFQLALWFYDGFYYDYDPANVLFSRIEWHDNDTWSLVPDNYFQLAHGELYDAMNRFREAIDIRDIMREAGLIDRLTREQTPGVFLFTPELIAYQPKRLRMLTVHPETILSSESLLQWAN